MRGRKPASSPDTFKILAEESPNVIFINKAGRVVFANKKAVELMGYSREEFYAPDFDFMELVAPEFHAETRRNFGEHARGREVPPYEYVVVTKEGRRIEAIIATRLVVYEGGPAILGIVTDISRLKWAEAGLRRSEERWRSLTENSPAFIFTTDKDGRLAFMNRRLPSGDPAELVGRSVCDFLLPAGRGAIRRAIEEVFRTGKAVSFESNGWAQDPTAWFGVTAGPVRTDGRIVGVVFNAMDITAAKRAEAGLRQAQKLASLGRLAAGLAHEINNPLSALSGEIQMVLERARDPKLASSLRFMDKVSLRIENIVRGLLEFSRQDPAADRQAVRLHDALDRTLKLVERRMALAGVRVKRRYGRSLPPLHANRGQLEQVFVNVLINGRDAMPDGGELAVSTRKAPGGFVEVCIADQGVGIPKEDLEHIFDPFFTTKPPGKGTGLGLSISHGIVSRHGGTIRVASRPGQGTRVVVRLPAGRRIGGNGNGKSKG